MATTPTPPSKHDAVLTVLQDAGGYVTLGLQLAGVFVPLVKGLISKIEGIGTGNVTIAFTDLVAADTAELDAITQLSMDDLTAINAELSRMGLPLVPGAPIVQSGELGTTNAGTTAGDTSAKGPAADPAPTGNAT